VADLVETVYPFGVDASSRLETSPGVKDMAKLADFFETIESLNS
jgi:phosphoribosylanthranilate isomerase